MIKKIKNWLFLHDVTEIRDIIEIVCWVLAGISGLVAIYCYVSTVFQCF